MKSSKIQWTHHTFNPWWGCTKVSEACRHCYAEAWAKRTGHDVWGAGGERRLFGEKHWAEPLKWDRKARKAGVRERVFCASMADVFEDHPALPGQQLRLWDLIRETTNLDWLLLTKRPENAAGMLPPDLLGDPRIWLGTTVEDQASADERLPHLLRTPAAVRFLSCEPLLGPVDLSEWIHGVCLEHDTDGVETCMGHGADWTPTGIDWVIIGGESGPGARPFDVQWARDLLSQCKSAGVAAFAKQLGARPYQSPEHDGGTGYELRLQDRKGGDPSEWPEDLRVRAFPTPAQEAGQQRLDLGEPHP